MYIETEEEIASKKEQYLNTKIATMDEVLAYKNDQLVYEFMDQYDVDFDEANGIFKETKRWLWVCAYWQKDSLINKNVPNLVVTYDLLILDEMWHIFMLYSQAYTDFCNKYFGYYLHHLPTPPPQNKIKKSKRPRGTEGSPFSSSDEIENRITKETLEEQLHYLYDLIGGDTIKLWYDTFPNKYHLRFFMDEFVKWE